MSRLPRFEAQAQSILGHVVERDPEPGLNPGMEGAPGQKHKGTHQGSGQEQAVGTAPHCDGPSRPVHCVLSARGQSPTDPCAAGFGCHDKQAQTRTQTTEICLPRCWGRSLGSQCRQGCLLLGLCPWLVGVHLRVVDTSVHVCPESFFPWDPSHAGSGHPKALLPLVPSTNLISQGSRILRH